MGNREQESGFPVHSSFNTFHPRTPPPAFLKIAGANNRILCPAFWGVPEPFQFIPNIGKSAISLKRPKMKLLKRVSNMRYHTQKKKKRADNHNCIKQGFNSSVAALQLISKMREKLVFLRSWQCLAAQRAYCRKYIYQKENEVWKRTSSGLNESEKALSLPT